MKKYGAVFVILFLLSSVSAWSYTQNIEAPGGYIFENIYLNYTANCSGEALLILNWSSGSSVKALSLPSGSIELEPHIGGNVSVLLIAPCKVKFNLTPRINLDMHVIGRLYTWRKRLVLIPADKNRKTFRISSPWPIVGIYIVSTLLTENETPISSANLRVKLESESDVINATFKPQHISENVWFIDSRNLNLSGNISLEIEGWKDFEVYAYGIAPVEKRMRDEYIAIFRNFTYLFGYWGPFKEFKINLEFFYDGGDITLLRFHGTPGYVESRIYLEKGRVCITSKHLKKCQGVLPPGPQMVEISFAGGYITVGRRNPPGNDYYLDVFTGFTSASPFTLLEGVGEKNVYAVDIYVSRRDFWRPQERSDMPLTLISFSLSVISVIGLIFILFKLRR